LYARTAGSAGFHAANVTAGRWAGEVSEIARGLHQLNSASNWRRKVAMGADSAVVGVLMVSS